MKFKKTKIEGLYIIEPELKIDKRGYFARIFCQKELAKMGLKFNIVQVNRSLTQKKGTIRGLHFQKPPKSEDKIVFCLKGAIFDVAVDLRKRFKTYRKWIGVELNEKNKRMLLIPKGFAHGFQTLTDNSEILYFMSEFYSPKHSSGIRWDDPFLKIRWPLKPTLILERDKNWPLINPKNPLKL